MKVVGQDAAADALVIWKTDSDTDLQQMIHRHKLLVVAIKGALSHRYIKQYYMQK